MSDDQKAIDGEIISKDAPEPIIREAEDLRHSGFVTAWRYRLEMWSGTKVAESAERFETALAAAEEARERRLVAAEGTAVARERLENHLQSILEGVADTVTADLTESKLRRLRAEHELARFETEKEITGLEDELTIKQLKEKLNPPEPEKPKPRASKPKRTYRDKIDDMLNYGTVGKHEAGVEEAIQQFTEERGGDENLTEEEHERILKTRQDAKRRDGGGF